MPEVLLEENGRYCLDCTKAVWATGEIHELYHRFLHPNCWGDVDWVVETPECLLLVEYKNAKTVTDLDISIGENNPYTPLQDKNFNQIVRKFHGSLPYLWLMGKAEKKPRHFVFVVEYPNDNSSARRRLRNRLKNALPFELQKHFISSTKLIEAVDVVNIAEWNAHPVYGQFPLSPV